MSDQTPPPDAVTPLYGAPVVDEDQAVTVVASWHNAPPTGEVEAPPVQEIRAWEEAEDGTVVAKVLEPPARPTRKAGPKAEAKMKGARAAGVVVDEAAASAKGKDIPLEGVAFAAVAVDHNAESA